MTAVLIPLLAAAAGADDSPLSAAAFPASAPGSLGLLVTATGIAFVIPFALAQLAALMTPRRRWR